MTHGSALRGPSPTDRSLDPGELRPFPHLLPNRDIQLGYRSLLGCGHRVFHLHGLERDQALPGLHVVSYCDMDRDYLAWRRRHAGTGLSLDCTAQGEAGLELDKGFSLAHVHVDEVSVV